MKLRHSIGVVALVLVLAGCGATDGDVLSSAAVDEHTDDGLDGGQASGGTDPGLATGADGEPDADLAFRNEDEAVLVALLERVSDGAFGDGVESCGATYLLDQSSDGSLLLSGSPNGSVDQLTLDDQLVLFEAFGHCADGDDLGPYLVERLIRGTGLADFGVEIPSPVTPCFGSAAVAEDGAMVLVAFSAIGRGQAPPSETKLSARVALTSCLPTSVLTDWLARPVIDDPVIAAATNQECLAGAFDDADLDPIWQLLVDSPGADLDALAPDILLDVLDPMFQCIAFGQVMAGLFEADPDGIVLSTATVTCIDAALTPREFADSILYGNNNPEYLEAIFGCWSPEELALYGGA